SHAKRRATGPFSPAPREREERRGPSSLSPTKWERRGPAAATWRRTGSEGRRAVRSERLEPDRRVALDLLDEGDFPVEVLLHVLFQHVAGMVVGLVPDVVVGGGGAIEAFLDGEAGGEPGGVAALEHEDLGAGPERRRLGHRER